MKYLIIIFILLYFIGEGATEGYTWADSEQRMENKIIKGGSEGNGILDYHGYRTLETCFVFFASIVMLGIGGLGTSMIGLFVYERILNIVNIGAYFKPGGWEYYIFGMNFKRYAYQDWLILVIGVTLVGYYFIMKQRSKA